MTEQTVQVRFVKQEIRTSVGKLADAELHFVGGLFDGLKLIGFAIWERRRGGRNVTFPARQYSINGERRSFALLCPVADTANRDRVRDYILQAWDAWDAVQDRPVDPVDPAAPETANV